MRSAGIFSHRLVAYVCCTVILLFRVNPVLSRQCPVYWDDRWQNRDELCEEDKKYHCFSDQNGNVASEGCYREKLCMKGAHPVVEDENIVCQMCRMGFQRADRLNSSTFTYSYCQSHSPPCNPEYGMSECRAESAERDRACTCNKSLGFVSKINGEDCHCFTSNDPCSGCKFIGCPSGSIQNDRGFCEPDKILTTTLPKRSSKTTPSPPPPTDTSQHGDDDVLWKALLGGILSPVLLLAVILIGFCICCKERYRQRITEFIVIRCKCLQRENRSQGDDDNDNGTSEPMIHEERSMEEARGNVTYLVYTEKMIVSGDSTNLNLNRVNQLHIAQTAEAATLSHRDASTSQEPSASSLPASELASPVCPSGGPLPADRAVPTAPLETDQGYVDDGGAVAPEATALANGCLSRSQSTPGVEQPSASNPPAAAQGHRTSSRSQQPSASNLPAAAQGHRTSSRSQQPSASNPPAAAQGHRTSSRSQQPSASNPPASQLVSSAGQSSVKDAVLTDDDETLRKEPYSTRKEKTESKDKRKDSKGKGKKKTLVQLPAC